MWCSGLTHVLFLYVVMGKDRTKMKCMLWWYLGGRVETRLDVCVWVCRLCVYVFMGVGRCVNNIHIICVPRRSSLNICNSAQIVYSYLLYTYVCNVHSRWSISSPSIRDWRSSSELNSFFTTIILDSTFNPYILYVNYSPNHLIL